MLQDYAQAFFAALALSAVAFGIAKLVAFLGERKLEQRYGGNLRDLFARRARLETGLEARKAERAAALREAQQENANLVRRRGGLERQVKDAQRAGDHLIRLIGEEVAGLSCYIALVVNKYVGTAGQQRAHAFVDSSWAQPQTIQVWARTMIEARSEIERRYPPAFGFVVTRLQDVAGPARPTKAANKDPADGITALAG